MGLVYETSEILLTKAQVSWELKRVKYLSPWILQALANSMCLSVAKLLKKVSSSRPSSWQINCWERGGLFLSNWSKFCCVSVSWVSCPDVFLAWNTAHGSQVFGWA